VGIRALDAALGTAARGWELVTDSIVGVNSRLEEATAAFQAFTGSAAPAAGVLEVLHPEGDRPTFSPRALQHSGRSLIQGPPGDQEAFQNLIRTAEVLAAMRPLEGLTAAAQALGQASRGDLEGLQRRFGVSADAIRAFQAQGVPALQAVDLALRQVGA